MNILTFGTAAWKFKPVAPVPPETWNRARIITTPGFVAEVCGVSVILSSFLSYAVYDVKREAAGGCAATGGDCDCGSENAEGVAGATYAGVDGVEVVAFILVLVPKRPRISSTVVRCESGGEEAPVVGDVDEPNISARRSWLLEATGWLRS